MKKWNKERFATIWEKLESMIALRSLRARIFLLTLVIGLVPCIAMRHGIVSNYEDLAVEQRTTVVQNQLMILANHLISNNYLSSHGVREDTGNSREVINAELEMLSNLYEGRVMIINKNFKVEKDTYGISEGLSIISEEVIKCFQGENISHYDPEHGYIEMTTPIMDTTANTTDENGKRNPDAIRGVMLTSISNDSIVNAKEVLNRKAYILEVIMMVAILALAIILSRALTRPFNRVTQAINAVKEGFSDDDLCARLCGDRTYRRCVQPAVEADEGIGRFPTGICGKCVPRVENTHDIHQGIVGFPASTGKCTGGAVSRIHGRHCFRD